MATFRSKKKKAPEDATVIDATVIVPAYNEAGCVADTIRSIQAQTLLPKEIVVIDDYSTDGTGDVARSCGATVLRPPRNTGSKAGAQTYALAHVRTPYVMAIDADTTLAPDAIEKLFPAFDDARVAAACGFVLPRHRKTLWERGRYIEYLFAFTFYKPLQDYYGKPLISSGCFSLYRTDAVRESGGWSNRTMAEDMDLTWDFYERGRKVRFIPEAVCYPIEPHTFLFMKKQLRRWSHGFVQNVADHWRGTLRVPFLRSLVAVSVWDATLASLAYLVVLPTIALWQHNPLYLLGYIIDAPAVFIPVVLQARRRGEVRQALASFPAFFALRVVNCFFILEAFVVELAFRRRLALYEKGH